MPLLPPTAISLRPSKAPLFLHSFVMRLVPQLASELEILLDMSW
jgi:hypothetical protein